jgi:hypothetical protein
MQYFWTLDALMPTEKRENAGDVPIDKARNGLFDCN